MWSGLISGFLFGFLLKRSRICIAGGLRDVYMEKKNTGLIVVLLIITAQSFIYFSLVAQGLINGPKAGQFSLVATVIGGLLFGLGAVISNGCITSSLIKAGDGRLAGLLSILSFMIFTSATRQGFLAPLSGALKKLVIVPDTLAVSLTVSPVIIAAIAFIIVAFWALSDKRAEKPAFTLPAEYTGARHLFFEKIWDRRVTALIIGIVAGFSYLLARVTTGNASGWGITTPLFTWFQVVSSTGKLTWGSFFVLGIVLGSFVCTKGSKEFSFQGADGKTLVCAFIGGILMSFGAVTGGGCMVGHGLAGTARLSVQSWVGLISIIAGIWTGVRLLYSDSIVVKK